MTRCVAILGATLALVLALTESAPAAEFDQYGIESASTSLSTPQAGAHPEFTASFKMKTDSVGFPFAQTRDIHVDLPPGLLANLGFFPQCDVLDFQNADCPIDSQLGIVEISAYGLGTFIEPLYYLTHGADTVARFGFFAKLYPNVINVRIRSQSDYGATASVEGALSPFPPVAATTTVWGVPADPSHDALRVTPQEALEGESPPGGGRSSSLPPAPLTVNPTRCGLPLAVGFTAVSYQLPNQPVSMSAPLGSISGCGKLGFAPSFSAIPTTDEAAAPSGLDATVTLPQNETVEGFATSHVRHVKVSFPAGMTIAPGAADGQEACSDAQAGYKSLQPAHCPDASKLGVAEIDVPALERPLQGALYLRTPEPGDLFRVWLVADDLGLHLALPGELEVDKATGQISSAFLEMPQAPLREAKIHVFGGPRGPLATPGSCGSYETHYEFIPWSGTAPVGGTAPMTIDRGCGAGGFSPKLSAGSTNPLAGAFSDFVTTAMRESDEANVSSLELTLPPGVSARIAGIPLCEGAAAASGSCPAASRVGRATVATGPGPTPLWLPQPGRDPIEVYLAGPYKGAPYSLIVKAPAQAGPFDLGTVVSRSAIEIDPETAQASIVSDPLPQILEGVPITYRTVHVDIDRPEFTLNPTSCEPMAVTGTARSVDGQSASLSDRFQVGSCERLRFKPKLSIRLTGPTHRGAFPALRAVLKMPKGGANIARASVRLPRSEFVENAHFRNICTRVQFAAEECPAKSVYGHAVATTPLLEQPLSGPVYLRSSSHKLPDLVIALKGQVEVDLVGRVDSVRGGLRTTFESAPDTPVTKFVVTMQGGEKGLFVNSRNLCAADSQAQVSFEAHNAKSVEQNPVLRTDCTKTARKHHQQNR